MSPIVHFLLQKFLFVPGIFNLHVYFSFIFQKSRLNFGDSAGELGESINVNVRIFNGSAVGENYAFVKGADMREEGADYEGLVAIEDLDAMHYVGRGLECQSFEWEI